MIRWLAFGIGLALVTVAGCTPAFKKGPHDVVFQRAPAPVLHEAPLRARESSNWWDEVLHSIVLPLGKLGSPAYLVTKTIGGPRALDVNAFEQVPDSTWFENRINRGRVRTSDIERGPDPSKGPATGVITIISGKLEGVSPGFVVRDAASVIWFVKFDPPTFPGLTTGAEMVTSRLLWAAGYHVPDNYLVDLNLSRLRLDPSARTRNDYNQSVPMTAKKLEVLLLQLNPVNGRLRALFSRSVPGQPVGPFRYRGVRRGDPNDTIAHERRRSLRALGVFFAWVANTDARHQNTMDTFISVDAERGLGYLKHYLIDFGDSLGSAGDGEKHTAQGYERRLEWHEIGLRWLTLGFRDPLWFRVKRSPWREVGVFESKVFDPRTWVPIYTNPAFLAADSDDAFWGASILAHFTRADIEAAVAAGEYRDDAAFEWISTVLLERRNKILRHVFAGRSPLDMPRVVDNVLKLTDLVVAAELPESPAQYEWRVRWNWSGSGDKALTTKTTEQPELPLAELITEARRRWGDNFARDPYFTITARRRHNGDAGPTLTIEVKVTPTGAMAVGLSR